MNGLKEGWSVGYIMIDIWVQSESKKRMTYFKWYDIFVTSVYRMIHNIMTESSKTH